MSLQKPIAALLSQNETGLEKPLDGSVCFDTPIIDQTCVNRKGLTDPYIPQLGQLGLQLTISVQRYMCKHV